MMLVSNGTLTLSNMETALSYRALSDAQIRLRFLPNPESIAQSGHDINLSWLQSANYRLLDVGWVPPGGRDWECFVRPAEMVRLLCRHGLAVAEMQGMVYNPFAGGWTTSRNLAVNYIVHARKPHA